MSNPARKTRSPDLFGWAPTGYPEIPGAKVAGTSRDAARRIASHAENVRAAVLAEFVAAHPKGLTADECANLVGESILTTRPRVTELKAVGLLEPTTDRRRNESGHAATVWIATPAANAGGRP